MTPMDTNNIGMDRPAHRRSQGTGGNIPLKMPKNTFLTKNCANFLHFYAQSLAQKAYIGAFQGWGQECSSASPRGVLSPSRQFSGCAYMAVRLNLIHCRRAKRVIVSTSLL